jgi:hypothetical protein
MRNRPPVTQSNGRLRIRSHRNSVDCTVGRLSGHHSQRKPLAKSLSEKRPTLNVEIARNSLSQWPTPATAVANQWK